MTQSKEPVAHRAWFDQDNGARWLFTIWPEEERLEVAWQPLYTAAALEAAKQEGRRQGLEEAATDEQSAQALEPAIVAAARALCKRASEDCGVNEEDNWALYGDSFRKDAEAALVAAAPHQPAAAQLAEVPEGWTPADAMALRDANHRFAAENQQLRQALRFYAAQHHFAIADDDAWDTVSGEPQNYWCDEAGTATVEDGSIAAMALRGMPLNWGDDGPPPVCKGEPEDIDIPPPPTQPKEPSNAD